jgi:hypothetical protein
MREALPGYHLRDCAVLGGYGHTLSPNTNVNLRFADDVVHVVSAGGPGELRIELADLVNIELGGGATQRGGGFVGGGFGLEGFAVGAAAASILNALTTSTQTATVVGLQWTEGELIVVSTSVLPNDLRVRLSHVFGAIRNRERNATPGRAPVDPVAQLARLGDLKERGLITPEEFDEAKGKLLSQL